MGQSAPFNAVDRTLERKYGSVFMLYLILLFTVVNGLLYVGIFYLLSLSDRLLPVTDSIYYPFIANSAAGFSGVIFSLLTVESYVMEQESYSFRPFSVGHYIASSVSSRCRGSGTLLSTWF